MTRLVEIKIQATFDDAGDLQFFVVENVVLSRTITSLPKEMTVGGDLDLSSMAGLKALPDDLTIIRNAFDRMSPSIKTILDEVNVGA
jgi:hypothetical protein